MSFFVKLAGFISIGISFLCLAIAIREFFNAYEPDKRIMAALLAACLVFGFAGLDAFGVWQ
ncbi:hypothetical protein MXMO3_01780 [Maritalea myrionectae]|uniref:Uncharacterized protein n=1 Tax=Maritalea myrionectae TaxID=454601 RepID=A0A2R4MED6_9HYPH|nr:hypothetical protein [Maritalea myrionectae]AVX04305.1 hypothetical protein MXMO3_01780 [Maritalea myrionectae]